MTPALPRKKSLLLPPFAALWDQLVWAFGSDGASATSALQVTQCQGLLSAMSP